MATRKLSFPYVLKKNSNRHSRAYNKMYAEAYSPNDILSLKGLCERVAMDQSVFTPEIARGVIDRLTVTMSELLRSGQSVKWDGLGTFHPEVESSGASEPEAYDINTQVKGIHIRFAPVNDKGEELTSRKFAESLVFSLYGTKTTQKVTKETGKTGYTGYITTAATSAAQRSLPLISRVDNAAPAADEDGDVVISLKAAGSNVSFSGSVEGVTYTLKRGSTADEATTLGTGKRDEGSAAPSFTIETSAQAADASEKPLWVTWAYRGKSHSLKVAQKSVIAE